MGSWPRSTECGTDYPVIPRALDGRCCNVVGICRDRSVEKFGLYALIVSAFLLATPAGQGIVDYLPFVGTVEESTVTYRQRLLEISIQVIMQNPYFGAFDYLYAPEMQQLKEGGMIDIVNSYAGVALSSGLVGLSLFSGFFIAVAIGIFKAMRGLPDRNDERYLLGQALLSTQLGILVIIFTVSSITVIPVIYWSVAGLGVAYARMLAHEKSPEIARPVGFQPATIKNW
jgi:O-antigen ligase